MGCNSEGNGTSAVLDLSEGTLNKVIHTPLKNVGYILKMGAILPKGLQGHNRAPRQIASPHYDMGVILSIKLKTIYKAYKLIERTQRG